LQTNKIRIFTHLSSKQEKESIECQPHPKCASRQGSGENTRSETQGKREPGLQGLLENTRKQTLPKQADNLEGEGTPCIARSDGKPTLNQSIKI
jgi:hypothetical protein